MMCYVLIKVYFLSNEMEILSVFTSNDRAEAEKSRLNVLALKTNADYVYWIKEVELYNTVPFKTEVTL